MKIINHYIYNEEVTFILFNQCFFLTADFIMCLLFSNKARWYQLHVLGNTIVTLNIINGTYNLYRDPYNNYRLLADQSASYIILSMHIHHILFFKLNLMDYFHHILFVLLGIVPTILWVKTNQIYYGYIACSGIPGIIEYTLLTLMKNGKISQNKQKQINAFIYNYIRCPMCIYGACTNITMLKYNKIIKIDNIYLTIYINLLLFLNGTIFNQLTLSSYYKHKYIKYAY